MRILLALMAASVLSGFEARSQDQLTLIDRASWDSVWEYLSLKYSCGYELPEGAGVVHVPQLHGIQYLKPSGDQEDYSFNLAAAGISQYHIASLLLESPDVAIFTEGGGKGVDVYCESMTWVKPAFPGSRLPPMSSLSHSQVEILVRLGAPCLLRALGLITRIEETESNSANLKAVSSVRKLYENAKEPKNLVKFQRRFERAQGRREKITTRKISNYQKSHPHQTIYLVYGSGHDFSDDFSGRNFERAKACDSLDGLLKSPENMMGMLSSTLGKAPINQRKLKAADLKKACIDHKNPAYHQSISIEEKIRFILEQSIDELCPVYQFETKDAGSMRVVDCELSYRGSFFLKPEGERICVGLREGVIYSGKSVHLRAVRSLSDSNALCREVEGSEFRASSSRNPAGACSIQNFTFKKGSPAPGAESVPAREAR
jgi:hypothetical protein